MLLKFDGYRKLNGLRDLACDSVVTHAVDIFCVKKGGTSQLTEIFSTNKLIRTPLVVQIVNVVSGLID